MGTLSTMGAGKFPTSIARIGPGDARRSRSGSPPAHHRLSCRAIRGNVHPSRFVDKPRQLTGPDLRRQEARGSLRRMPGKIWGSRRVSRTPGTRGVTHYCVQTDIDCLHRQYLPQPDRRVPVARATGVSRYPAGQRWPQRDGESPDGCDGAAGAGRPRHRRRSASRAPAHPRHAARSRSGAGHGERPGGCHGAAGAGSQRQDLRTRQMVAGARHPRSLSPAAPRVRPRLRHGRARRRQLAALPVTPFTYARDNLRMTAVQKPSQGDDDEIDLGELLGILLDHRWLIIIVTGAFFVISVAYALLATPVYQANATVQVEQKVPSLPGLSDIASTLGSSTSQATTEIALITSRTVVGAAAANLRFAIEVSPRRFPLIGDFIARRYAPDQAGEVAPPALGMNSYDWGGATLDVLRLDVP